MKSIREDAHAFIEDVRFYRLQQERCNLLISRFSTPAIIILNDPKPENSEDVKSVPEDDLQPQFSDYALLPEIRSVLADPGDTLASTGQLSRLSEDQDALIKQWKQAIEDELIGKLRAILVLPDDVDDPLSLAIASFVCKGCHQSVPPRYPALLTHRCLRQTRYILRNDVLYEATVEEYALALDSRSALNADKITVDAQMIQRLTAIIETRGLDPLHVSQDALENCEGRMYCAYTKCQIDRTDSLYLTGCNWLSAVRIVLCFFLTVSRLTLPLPALAHGRTPSGMCLRV